jgi:hypothetical protein
MVVVATGVVVVVTVGGLALALGHTPRNRWYVATQFLAMRV